MRSATLAFTYDVQPGRVLFGVGRLDDLGAEIERLGCHRALLLSTPEQTDLAQDVLRRIAPRGVGCFSGAAMHTPVDVTDAALARLQALSADCLVAVGGGSTIGLGKTLALRTGLALIAVPTTYAGSEMTQILGETKGGRKTTLTSPQVLPKVVIYDPGLTLSLPSALSVTSGINAIAHAVEALYARNGNPVVSLIAEEGIAALTRSLVRIVASPRDIAARADAQYGAWLCGACLGAVGMALHHKVCHVLGGTFALPHAETHTVMLPHVVAYNADAAPEAMRRLARALGADDPAQALHALCVTLGAPTALSALGMPEAGLDRAADDVLQNAYWNPRLVERDAIRAMLQRAWTGAPP